MKTTGAEFEAYCNSGEYALSDIDYGWNKETQAWDVPKVEWDSIYGTHWSTYVSEEARTAALDEYDAKVNAWVLNYRIEQKAAKEAKRVEKQRMAEINQLGQPKFSELAKLMSTMVAK